MTCIQFDDFLHMTEEQKKAFEEKAQKEFREKLERMFNGGFLLSRDGQLPTVTGWICPKCGCVYGTAATVCTRCNPPIEYKVTC
jgi:rubrerythrin